MNAFCWKEVILYSTLIQTMTFRNQYKEIWFTNASTNKSNKAQIKATIVAINQIKTPWSKHSLTSNNKMSYWIKIFVVTIGSSNRSIHVTMIGKYDRCNIWYSKSKYCIQLSVVNDAKCGRKIRKNFILDDNEI